MSTPIDNLINLNFFSNLKIANPKGNQETIQETIKEDKQFLINFFEKQPYYSELMPTIKKASRGTSFYKGLIKNGLKYHSVFFQAIMNSIKKVNEEKRLKLQNEKKVIRVYKLPKIDELKIRKNKIEDIRKKKIKLIQLEKEKLKVYKEQMKKQIFPFTTINRKSPLISHSSTINFFNNRYNQSYNNSISNSFTKHDNSTEKYDKKLILSPINNDISTYYKSNNTFKNVSGNGIFSNYIKNYKMSNSTNNAPNLIDICREEIDNGKEIEELISDYNKNFMKSIQEKLINNRYVNRDHKILDERNRKKDKYIQLEEHNYANIKRRMNEKISNSFAYRNRKELREILKINKNAESYILHLNEINKINEKMGRRRMIERKRIEKVNSLCDEGFKKNENLKNKIDIINNRNLKLSKSNDNILNDDFLINRELKDNLNGTLVPKLMTLKLANEKKFLSII